MNPAKALIRRTGLRRSHVAAVRMCCERNALAAFGATAAPRSRILCYHSVGTPAWGTNDVSPARFRRHIEVALEHGYRFVPAATLARGEGEVRDLAITFDDGLLSVATNAAPILAEYNIPWSLFVVSDWAEGKADDWAGDALMGWREIERLAAGGATIGSHSVTHPSFGRLERDAVAYELDESRRAIESRLGIVATSFAIPLGQSGDWTRMAGEMALAAGYDTIYAQAEETRAAGTVPRTFITRFDSDRVFRAALGGAFDRWEEWL